VNVEPATLKRLSAIENIVGVKEASGNVSQMARVVHEVPPSFDVLCGDDSLTISLTALGGCGVISVLSNELPAEMTKLTQLALAGDFAGARAMQRRLFDLMEINFVEANPIPVKTAMALMGLLDPVWRLPMCPPSDASKSKIEAVLKAGGWLNEYKKTHAARGTHAD
jgi:4-hydroxy-tetrahydrodipicolinate synthase